MHEFTEVANYYTCYMTEVDPRIKEIWEMFLSYEIEHLRIAGEALQARRRHGPAGALRRRRCRRPPPSRPTAST